MLRDVIILAAGFCLVASLSFGRPANADEKSVRKNTAQQIHRPEDLRQARDEAKLAEAGIHVYKSRRLKLYTDIESEIAQTLPPLIDQLYVALEDYFGPMPPDKAGTPFQMSAFLMRDIALFRELGLVPEELLIEHGRHQRNEFWMRDQKSDYYRRHLLIHEATHCFMTFMPAVTAPLWYMEGMAEYFGTHRLDRDQKATFRIIPTSELEFAGFARIATVREEIAERKFQSIPTIFAYRPAEFVTVHYYAWSWALCVFLDQTPSYHDRFQKLGQSIYGSNFLHMYNEFFAKETADLTAEWTLFAANLQFGYDSLRASIDFRRGTKLGRDRTVEIHADRGWQSSGVLLEKGQRYQISAAGRVTLANQPKHWESEPQGISFRYFDGRPIGMILGCVRTEPDSNGEKEESMLRVFSVGRTLQFQSPADGTLYLRVNDAWNSLADNKGEYQVTVGPESP